MKSAIIALDPKVSNDSNFKNFCKVVKLFQDNKILSECSITSVIYPTLFTMPLRWFQEMKQEIQKETLNKIEQACMGQFEFKDKKVLISSSSVTEDVVQQLARFTLKMKKNIMVLSSNSRTGLPYWILGSFSETASLISPAPVLIIKPHLRPSNFSKTVRILVAIDVNVKMNRETLNWIISLARYSNAEIDLIHVSQEGISPVHSLTALEQKINKSGIKVRSTILKQDKSVAHTITEYATKKQVWLTVTIDSEKSKLKKIFMGSTSRRVLSLSKTPFMNLRSSK